MCEIMDNYVSEIMESYVKESNEIAKVEKAISIAKNMLENGISLDMVIKCSDLPQETVLKLQNEMILT